MGKNNLWKGTKGNFPGWWKPMFHSDCGGIFHNHRVSQHSQNRTPNNVTFIPQQTWLARLSLDFRETQTKKHGSFAYI